MKSFNNYNVVTRVVPVIVLIAGCAVFIAYLQARYPYGGVYGQDAYGYYYHAVALWQEFTGQERPSFQVSGAGGFHWPVGYPLHLLLGFLIGGEGVQGGRLANLLMLVAVPVLVYLLVGRLWHDAPVRSRIVAGLMSAGMLVLVATYIRMGLSTMADVPALFWGLAAVYCGLGAWPPDRSYVPHRVAWAVGMGAMLGMSVLVRYSSLLLLVPLGVYGVVRGFQEGGAQGLAALWKEKALWWSIPAFVVMLLPQLAYMLTYGAGAAYLRAGAGWGFANIFSTTTTSSEGSVSFEYPMIVFYLLSPLANISGGLLSGFYLPAFILGLGALAWQRRWPMLALLLSWWVVPALFYSLNTFQTHRYVLLYMPPLVILVGIGTALAIETLLSRVRKPVSMRALGIKLGMTLLLVGVCVGGVQGWTSVHRWMATHAEFEVAEKRLAAVVRQAVEADASDGINGTPRLVTLDAAHQLHHHTGWPVIDFYNQNESELEDFLRGDGPQVAVVSEGAMSSQWAGSIPGARWAWLQKRYTLIKQGESGVYTVYRMRDNE